MNTNISELFLVVPVLSIKQKKKLQIKLLERCTVYFGKLKDLLYQSIFRLIYSKKTVKPILFYGCELWAFENNQILEKVQLKFLKYMLDIKKSTPTHIIYGETGVYPLSIDIETRFISFW